jgi:surface polysaccharide O-acyltransferase-like enzyme
MTKRILELDIIRAFAIILIVFSHLPPITGFPIDPIVKYWSAIVGVSLFLFISGIILSPPKSIKQFYKKRAIRIYPPYLIIMAVYVVIQYVIPDVARTLGIYLNPSDLAINLVGLQAVLNVPSYGVLWFVGVILVYYALYPFLGTKPIRIIAFSAATIVLFIALHQFGLVIPQMVYYWPIFIVGVMLRGKIPSRLVMSNKIKPALLIASASFWIYLTHMLVIGAIVLILSASSAVPLVDTSNSSNNTTMNVTVTKNATTATVAATKQPHYILYYFTMSAPCPEGVQMQKEVTAWAKAHPEVEFHVEDADGSLGAKYNSVLSPTTVLLKDDKMVSRIVGIFDVNDLNLLTSG